MAEPRLSMAGLKVLRFLTESSSNEASGADIARKIGVGSGTLYPLLYRFEGAGWLRGTWEDIDPGLVGRPRRRLYSLTAEGRRAAHNALAEVSGSHGALAWNI